LRLQAQGGNNTVCFPYAYGWFNAFDKLLTVKAGLVDDGTWNTGGYILGLDVGEGLGALAKVTPIDGLTIGVGAYVQEAPGSGGTVGATPKELDETKYTVGLGYTLPEVVKFAASYRTKSKASSTGEALSSDLRAGVSLLMVPKLKAILEVELDNLQDFGGLKKDEYDAFDRKVGDGTGTTVTPIAASGKINIYETFQYDMGALSVGLWAVEWISQADDADFSFYVTPWVSYTLGSIIPKLELSYGSGAQNRFNYSKDSDGKYSNVNWYRENIGALYNNDYSVISVRPSVKFNLDPKTFVEIGDLINIDNGPSNVFSNKTKDSRISNVFYVDFKWAF
jgi:hypothetical protein